MRQKQNWVEGLHVMKKYSVSKFSAQLKGRRRDTWKGFIAQLKSAVLSDPILQSCQMGDLSEFLSCSCLGKGSFGE